MATPVRPSSPPTWTPSLGALAGDTGTSFRVWAPDALSVEVCLEPAGTVHALERDATAMFTGHIAGVGGGARYRYRLNGERLLPDPASRWQPDGVHGPSQVIDPARFAWADTAFRGLPIEELVIYEVHVGTFSGEASFAGLTARLPDLARLGVTAIELMPVADFPGTRNWGYDGVSLFAPAHGYGTPDELRTLVDAAHRLGLAVLLDVVYNHLGPDGAYLGAFSRAYFTDRHQTPWGAGLNLDGADSRPVRDFFIENACHWICEYRMDGLRLDATHAIADDSARHFVAELTGRVREAAPHRHVVVIAEDHRNVAAMLRPERAGGWGLDGLWADDFHHECRRLLAGDSDGYYRDYRGDIGDLATTLDRGWLYTGQWSHHLGAPRGTDPSGLSRHRFVIALQNHDQIGNRAHGERLHAQIDSSAYRAASVLLLTAPETPLLFMGQDWAATSPFLYFTDHHEQLGAMVTAGRREEFKHFAAFSDAPAREGIPDPQLPATFERSRLDWGERDREPHASTWRLYHALLALRRHEPALRRDSAFQVAALDVATIAMRFDAETESVVVVVRLAGAGTVPLSAVVQTPGDSEDAWQLVLTSEDAAFAIDPMPPTMSVATGVPTVRFLRPSAVILKCARPRAARGA